VLDSCVARLMLNDDKASDSDCDSSSVYEISKILVKDLYTIAEHVNIERLITNKKTNGITLTRISSSLFALDFSLVLI